MQRNVKIKNFTHLLFLLCSICFVTPSFSQLQIPKKYQLKTVIIDAGHGGHDLGVNGQHHKEKDLVLNYAQLLGQKIKQQYPEINVIYTRQTDTFVSLSRRSAFANARQADLFISIHCNGGITSEQGTETYVFSPQPNAVAARENNSILIENFHQPIGGGFVQGNQQHYKQSLYLANAIERHFSMTMGKSRGSKQGNFIVLKDNQMPSVLVQTGFLTNASNERQMASQRGKQTIVNAIFEGFKDYKTVLDEYIEKHKSNNVEYQLNQERERKRLEAIEAFDRETTARIQRRKRERANKQARLSKRRNPKNWAYPKQIVTKETQYYVQLKISNKPNETIQGFENVVMERIEMIDSYKYLIGAYKTIEEAKQVQRKAQKNGFSIASILVYKEGKLQK